MACLVDPFIYIVYLVVGVWTEATSCAIVIFIAELKEVYPVVWDLEQRLINLTLKIIQPGGVVLVKVETEYV